MPRGLAAAVLLAAAGTAVYSNSFDAAFVFDGVLYLTENPVVRQLGRPEQLLFTGHTRPLAFLTFGLNYAAGGFQPWGWHAVNLAIHVLAGLTLLGLVRRTLQTPRLAPRFGPVAWPLATTAAILWLVHPLQTQSVTYIYQRCEALAGLWYLLTLYSVLRAATSSVRLEAGDDPEFFRQLRQAGTLPGWSRRWTIAAVASCAAGMLSKEVMITAPLAALGFDRIFLAASWRDVWFLRRGLHLGLASTWLLLAALVAGHWDQYAAAGLVYVEGVSMAEYARSQPQVILRYLQLAFWPAGQCLDYAWPVAEWNPATWAAMGVVGLGLAATLWCIFRRPTAGYLAGMFFLVLAPTSSLLPSRDLIFEHRMYLPLACVALGVVLAGYVALDRLCGVLRVGRGARRALWVGLPAAAAVALGTATLVRNRAYQSSLACWSDVVAKAPHNVRARSNLGMELLVQGEHQAALAQFDAALRLQSGDFQALHNRALACLHLGRGEEALAAATQAIAAAPQRPDGYSIRAVANQALGRAAAALDDYSAALQRDPDAVEPLANRAALYASRGEYDLALRDRSRVVGLEPHRVESWQARAATYSRAGRLALAAADLVQAITLAPDNAALRWELGQVRQQQGQHRSAIAAFDAALRLDPQLAAAYEARALSHFAAGQYDAARADVQRFQQLGGQPNAELLRRLSSASNR